MKNVKNKITLKLKHYIIKGNLQATHKNSGKVISSEMNPFKSASLESDDLIIAGLNFGCRKALNSFWTSRYKIDGACVDVYAVYEEVGNDAPGAVKLERYVYSKIVGSVSDEFAKRMGF
jgi:hypothetical protein